MTSPVTLTDAIKLAVQNNLNSIHTALPGSIISYDYTKQMASVQPLLNKVWTDGTETPMPVLQNVPVIFPKSGGASLTFPVNAGDTCLLLFIERSTDLWKTQGGQVSPNDDRSFSLSDSVAIMGLFPFSESSQAINNTDVFLTYNGSYFQIKQDGSVVINTSNTIALGNSVTEVLSVLSQILGFLSSLTAFTAPPNPAAPFNFYLSALSLKTQVDAIKGTIP